MTSSACSPDELRTLFLFEKLSDAQFESVPGDTRFRVRLPVAPANQRRSA